MGWKLELFSFWWWVGTGFIAGWFLLILAIFFTDWLNAITKGYRD